MLVPLLHPEMPPGPDGSPPEGSAADDVAPGGRLPMPALVLVGRAAGPGRGPSTRARRWARVLPPGAVRAVRAVLARGGDAGMTTAEYAVGTLAAVAFAGVLLKVVTSHAVQAALAAVVQRALR